MAASVLLHLNKTFPFLEVLNEFSKHSILFYLIDCNVLNVKSKKANVSQVDSTHPFIF